MFRGDILFMAIPTAGLYRLTLTQTLTGQVLENVFYYHNSSDIPTVSLTILGNDWLTNKLPSIAAIQAIALSYNTLRVADVLGTAPDVILVPATTNGTLAGEASASYVSIGFRYNPLTKITRPGAKRFAGQTEPVTIANVISASYRTSCETAATALNAIIGDGVNSYAPVIFGTPNANRATNVTNPVLSITVDSFLTTQVSRKQTA